MGFGWGIVIGIIVGANLGIIWGAVLAASKRRESTQDLLWDQLHAGHSVMDQAVMDEPVAGAPLAGNHRGSAPALASQPNSSPVPHV